MVPPPPDWETAAQPILLTTAEHNPNGATVRFLLDSVPMPSDAGSYERLVLMFDGEDDDAVAVARERWGQANAQGFEVT
jgi:DNA polymerase IIIc chi subunit